MFILNKEIYIRRIVKQHKGNKGGELHIRVSDRDETEDFLRKGKPAVAYLLKDTGKIATIYEEG